MIELHENDYYSCDDAINILDATTTHKATTKSNKITYIEDIYAFDIETTSYKYREDTYIVDESIYHFLKGTTIKINTDIYNDIPDFNEIRKSLFGKLYFSKSSGVKIDNLYSELNNRFPSYLNPDVYALSDMLLNIIELFRNNTPDYNPEIKTGLMYVWQFAINGYVIIGRTWDEFISLCNQISDYYNLNDNKRIIIWVHSLSFEMQFLKSFFNWNKVFAIANRKPIYALTDIGIEFRCSYILSGYNLKTLAENLHHYNISKLVGDLDYDLPRHEDTKLTDEEINYCINDVLIVSGYIQEEIIRNKSIAYIPLTATGYARRYVSKNCLNKDNYAKYSKFIHSLNLDPEEYKQLRRCFQGGFTHASCRYINKTISGKIDSFDFTSSYPYGMISEKQFPMSSGELVSINSIDEFNHYLKHYCCVFDIEFQNLTPLILNENYIAYYKCYNMVNPLVNNGRVVSSDRLAITITNIDFEIISKMYSWDNIKVKNFRIYQRGYLPREIIDAILTLYENKTKLKGVTGKEEEYQHAKGLLNALYGMLCMSIDKRIYKYDNIQGWFTETEELEKCIMKYNNSKKRFSFYPWAVFVTSICRRNLILNGILPFGDDYIYSDTDSIKCINADKHMNCINEYNKQVETKLKRMCEHYGFDFNRCKPKTIKGEEKLIGVWEHETNKNPYSRFKTLGAKRYIYEQWNNKENKNELHITIAGVGKSKGSEYLSTFKNPFDKFTHKLNFPSNATGKLTHYYIDDPCYFTLMDYQGNIKECYSPSGVYLEPTPYNLTIEEQFRNYILMITGELII